jgi:phosphoribosylformylglycinamidine synthase PurS subunit
MAKVYVSLKPGVADPQGKTIKQALNDIGFPEITGVRVGKVFDISYDGDKGKLKDILEEVSRKVLANPVIEDFVIEE